MELIASGRTIEAIKRFREETGLGLAEAKEEVERIASGASGLPSGADE
jgi:ribosomal protein L7/L12